MEFLYQKQPLKDYVSTLVKNPNDLNLLNSTMEEIITREYQTNRNMDLLIEDILKREEIRKIISGEYQKPKKNSWNYHNIPLKQYLEGLLENKEDLNFLYDTIKRILKKEYTPGINLDSLIDDILSQDKIQQIIKGTYEKRKTKSWYYHKVSLRQYLYSLLENKEDVDYLYYIVSHILEKEYTSSCNMDSLIEDILSRTKIQEIISGNYSKKEETEWIYQGMALSSYVEKYIQSPYRSSAQIVKGIRTHVSSIMKRKNLDVSKREELIDIYLSSDKFQKILSTPPAKRNSYFYHGMTLRNYVKERIQDTDNFNYVYKFITSKIMSMYQEKNQDLELVIHFVMESEEVKELLNTDIISKQEKEEWPYKEGLLIDYLKTINLNGKRVATVYSAIKNAINRRHEEEFSPIQEKKEAIEEFVDSKEFQNYLEYGYIEKCYFYSGMLLIDYLRIYYEDSLKSLNKTLEDLYKKVIYMAFKNQNVEDLSQKEIEEEIDFALRSNEMSEYLHRPKIVFEDWSYKGEPLKNIILREYSSVIENDQDLTRIYGFITDNARKIKKENPDMTNEIIIESFLEEEFVKDYIEKYSKRKRIRNEVQQKTRLYKNRDDFQYISLYAKENNLDITEIVRITHLGFNYYSAIMILEYARKFHQNVDEIVNFTLNMDKTENNSLLWLVKLGFRDYIWNVIENNKSLIRYLFLDNMKYSYKNSTLIEYEDLYQFLSEQLSKRFIVITTPIEYMFLSFKSFIYNCIKGYVIEKGHNPCDYRCNSMNDDNHPIVLISEDNLETNLIESETSNIIMDALDLLDNLEREFINLRYGFNSEVNNLFQIQSIWNAEGIQVSIEELERMDKIVLEKLRENPKILEMRQTA